MAGLQRSTTSFRRQGSSGLVWDDKFLMEEINKKEAHDRQLLQEQNQEIMTATSSTDNNNNQELKDDLTRQERRRRSTDGRLERLSVNTTTLDRSRSTGRGGVQQQRLRTDRESPAAVEPPSPKVSACGFCSAFGKPPKNHRRNKGATGKVRSR